MVREGTARLTRIALMGAMLYAGQVALAAVMNIEVVTLLIVVFTKRFGKDGIFACFVYVMLTLQMGGFGLWWATYLVVWPSFALLVYFLRNMDNWLIWAVINGAFGLCFGALFAVPYIFIKSLPYAITWWINGIPADINHCIGNFVIALLLGKILDEALARVVKYTKRPT